MPETTVVDDIRSSAAFDNAGKKINEDPDEPFEPPSPEQTVNTPRPNDDDKRQASAGEGGASDSKAKKKKPEKKGRSKPKERC